MKPLDKEQHETICKWLSKKVQFSEPTITDLFTDEFTVSDQQITVNGTLLFELISKQDWLNRVPRILPKKTRNGEQWLWVDANGNIFECGIDFIEAEKMQSYPCRVYRLQNVSGVGQTLTKNNT